MGWFDVSANSIGVFSILCSFKLLIYFILLSSQNFINWSVQNAFKFSLYSNRSRLILLRQISNDNLLKAPLKSKIFKYKQHEHILNVNSGRFRIKNCSCTV